uniref:Uncharacterized protein n=1 Tax=Rhizophora mucronata TaxID=61149 RepID=A0A2P2PRI9_RHIMU
MLWADATGRSLSAFGIAVATTNHVKCSSWAVSSVKRKC